MLCGPKRASSQIDDGSDPSVGLPRKDDSTSVIYRVAAYQLECPTPLVALPAKRGVGFLFRWLPSHLFTGCPVYSTTKEKSFERLPSSFTTDAVYRPGASLFFLVLNEDPSNDAFTC